MRLIRWAGENISPSDDGRLYEKIFVDGLYKSTTAAVAGGSAINIGAMYGVVCGREFTSDAMTINATLPSSETKHGIIYLECNTASDTPLSVKTTLAENWTPTRADINVSGTLTQVELGWYTATPTGVTEAQMSNVRLGTFGRSVLDEIEDTQHELDSYETTNDLIVNTINGVADNLNKTILGKNIEGTTVDSPLFVVHEYTSSYSVGANSSATLSANDFNFSTPTGYAPVSVSRVASGSNGAVIRHFAATATGTQAALVLQNVTSNAITASAAIRIVYAKSTTITSF